MNQLEQLPEISDHVLNGLRADEILKYRICQTVAERDTPRCRLIGHFRLSLAALLCLSVIMIVSFILLDHVQSIGPSDISDIQTVTAGRRMNDSPIQLQMIIDQTVGQYTEDDQKNESISSVTDEMHAESSDDTSPGPD